jgi:four helix bundle protein
MAFKMKYFDHEKLDVYRAGIELVILIDEIVQHFPRGRAYLTDQLQRAGASVPLNIAEGAGEFSNNEKGRFYRMAKRSATECAGIFDICRRLQIIEEQKHAKGRELLIRIVSMLTKMAQGTGNGSTGIASESFVNVPVCVPVPDS